MPKLPLEGVCWDSSLGAQGHTQAPRGLGIQGRYLGPGGGAAVTGQALCLPYGRSATGEVNGAAAHKAKGSKAEGTCRRGRV